jgi:hypothetical protein
LPAVIPVFRSVGTSPTIPEILVWGEETSPPAGPVFRRAALVTCAEERAERMEARFMRELGERIRRGRIAAIHVRSRHDA